MNHIKLALVFVVACLALVPCIASGAITNTSSLIETTQSISNSIFNALEDLVGDDDTDENVIQAGEEVFAPSDELVAWSESLDCNLCHIVEEESLADENCTISYHANLDCIWCHADDTLIDVHEDVDLESKLPKKLKKTEVDIQSCLSCHSIDNLVETTRDSEALTDENGTVVNPHNIPDVSEHDSISCVSCHQMHSSKTAQSAARKTCTSCHHQNIYACYTCHS